MLIPSGADVDAVPRASLSRRVNANSQLMRRNVEASSKLIKKGEC